MTDWFIADVENNYGGTYAQFIRAEDLPKMWSKIRGLENTNYPPPENAKGPATEEELLEIQSKLKPLSAVDPSHYDFPGGELFVRRGLKG